MKWTHLEISEEEKMFFPKFRYRISYNFEVGLILHNGLHFGIILGVSFFIRFIISLISKLVLPLFSSVKVKKIIKMIDNYFKFSYYSIYLLVIYDLFFFSVFDLASNHPIKFKMIPPLMISISKISYLTSLCILMLIAYNFCEELAIILKMKHLISKIAPNSLNETNKSLKNKKIKKLLSMNGIEEWKIEIFKGEIQLEKIPYGYIYLIGSRIRSIIIIISIISFQNYQYFQISLIFISQFLLVIILLKIRIFNKIFDSILIFFKQILIEITILLMLLVISLRMIIHLNENNIWIIILDGFTSILIVVSIIIEFFGVIIDNLRILISTLMSIVYRNKERRLTKITARNVILPSQKSNKLTSLKNKATFKRFSKKAKLDRSQFLFKQIKDQRKIKSLTGYKIK